MGSVFAQSITKPWSSRKSVFSANVSVEMNREEVVEEVSPKQPQSTQSELGSAVVNLVSAAPSARSRRFTMYHAATILLEGNVGLHHTRGDVGAETAWGFSSAAHPDLAERIRRGNFTKEDSFKYAYERYYGVIPFIESVDPRIGFVVYDSEFHGFDENILFIQEYLKKAGYDIGRVDGHPGKLTMSALMQLNADDVTHLLKELSNFSSSLVELAAKQTKEIQRKKGLPVVDFSASWNRRQKGRLDYARTMEA